MINKTNMDDLMTNMDLIGLAFKDINAYKRHRVLAESARRDGNTEEAIYHELKRYKYIDSLELTLRAIQKGLREIDELPEDN